MIGHGLHSVGVGKDAIITDDLGPKGHDICILRFRGSDMLNASCVHCLLKCPSTSHLSLLVLDAQLLIMVIDNGMRGRVDVELSLVDRNLVCVTEDGCDFFERDALRIWEVDPHEDAADAAWDDQSEAVWSQYQQGVAE